MLRSADINKDSEELLRGFRAFREFLDDPTQLPEKYYNVQEQQFLTICKSPFVTVHVDEDVRTGKLTGGIGLISVPDMWSPAITTVEELFWFCHEDAPKNLGFALLRIAVNTAKIKAARLLLHASVKSDPRIERIYTKLGLHKTYYTYQGLYA